MIFADEAQDLNRMQLTLIRKWGERANYFILAGDDDQTIFSFTGASPDAILDPDIPEDHKIILKQSYRVPRAVHQRRERTDPAGHATPGEGLPGRGRRMARYSGSRPWTYKSPEYFILKSAEEHLEHGKTVMFLASCSYMLQPLVAVLRKSGIPFHNPYRQDQRLLESAADRQEGFDRQPHPGAAGGAPGVRRRPPSVDPRRSRRCGPSAWQSKGILRHGAKKKLQQTMPAQTGDDGASRRDLRDGRARIADGCLGGDYRALLEWWRTAGHRRRSRCASSFRQTLPPRVGRTR